MTFQRLNYQILNNEIGTLRTYTQPVELRGYTVLFCFLFNTKIYYVYQSKNIQIFKWLFMSCVSVLNVNSVN